jgi:hypothetical protein
VIEPQPVLTDFTRAWKEIGNRDAGVVPLLRPTNSAPVSESTRRNWAARANGPSIHRASNAVKSEAASSDPAKAGAMLNSELK